MPVLLTNINLYSYLYSLCICVYLWWIGGGLTINLELPARLKPIWQTTPCAGWPGPPRCTLPPTTWRALPFLCSITWPSSEVGMEWIGVHWTKCIVHSVQLYNTQCTLQYIVPPDTCTWRVYQMQTDHQPVAGPLEYQVQRGTSVNKLCKNRTQQTVYIGLFTLNSIKVKSPQKFQSEQARSSEGSAPCPVLSTIHS